MEHAQRVESALYLVLVLGAAGMSLVTGTAAFNGDPIAWPFAAVFSALTLLIGWVGRSHVRLAQWAHIGDLIRRHWRIGIIVAIGATIVAYAAYAVVAVAIWIITESPEQRQRRERSERYDAWKSAMTLHVNACARKNAEKHFGPMLGFELPGSCGINGRHNGVACTANGAFHDKLANMWDRARERNACVVWEPSRVTWKGADRMYRGVTAYADDGIGGRISIALRSERKIKQ